MNKDIWLKKYPKNVPKEINVSHYASIPEFQEEACKKYSNSPLLYFDGKSLSYSEFETHTKDFAAFLQKKLHLNKGDRLGIMLPNSLEAAISLLGGQRAGLITVGFNPLLTTREFIRQANDAEIETLVIFEGALPVVRESYKKTSIKHIVLASTNEISEFDIPVLLFQDCLEIGKKLDFTPVDIKRGDVALLQYTGGTTGIPKRGYAYPSKYTC